jgi:hypothetical protein
MGRGGGAGRVVGRVHAGHFVSWKVHVAGCCKARRIEIIWRFAVCDLYDRLVIGDSRRLASQRGLYVYPSFEEPD